MAQRATRKAARAGCAALLQQPLADLHRAVAITPVGRAIIQCQQCQHRPGQVAAVAASLVAVLGPPVLFIIPPAGQLDRLGPDRSRQIGVAQAAILPVTVMGKREQDRVPNPRRLGPFATADQRNGRHRIVIDKGRVFQRWLAGCRIGRQETRPRRIAHGAGQRIAGGQILRLNRTGPEQQSQKHNKVSAHRPIMARIGRLPEPVMNIEVRSRSADPCQHGCERQVRHALLFRYSGASGRDPRRGRA